jgi:hypothetical protein
VDAESEGAGRVSFCGAAGLAVARAVAALPIGGAGAAAPVGFRRPTEARPVRLVAGGADFLGILTSCKAFGAHHMICNGGVDALQGSIAGRPRR